MANLWASYQSDTLTICMLAHFLKNNGDSDVQDILKYTLEVAKQHVETLTAIFKKQCFPIPVGFGKDDVNLDAPRLYSDAFYLDYVKDVGKVGISTFGLALATSAREDIRKYYEKCVHEATKIYQMTADILLKKGIFVRPPLISQPKTVEFITDKDFYGHLFGQERPLTAPEISHISNNIEANLTGHTLLLGFSQVAKNKTVRDHMLKGKDMAKHHIDKLRGMLDKDDVPSPMAWSETVTESTTSPFSDKLMMFHTTILTAAGTGNYGLSMAASPRKDLAATYMRLFVEAGDYSKSASDIMIEKGWLERPPQVVDRKQLSRS